MASIGHPLMIKYGLNRAATDAEAAAWAKRVSELVAAGTDREEAGEIAASELLPGYGTIHYRSEADTLEMLLQRLKDQ